MLCKEVKSEIEVSVDHRCLGGGFGRLPSLGSSAGCCLCSANYILAVPELLLLCLIFTYYVYLTFTHPSDFPHFHHHTLMIPQSVQFFALPQLSFI